MGPNNPGVGRCVESLVGVYERTGRSAEAAKWRSRLSAAK